MLRRQREVVHTRQGGATLVFVLLILFMILAFSAGHLAVVQGGYKQAAFFCSLGELRQYAESGLALGIHDLQHNGSGHSGNIGTERWTLLSDSGRDGAPGTLDAGEHDGIPTPGEPDLHPVAVGRRGLEASLMVSVHPTPYVGVFLLASTCIGRDSYVTLKKVYRAGAVSLSAVAALSVHPGAQLFFGDLSEVAGEDALRAAAGKAGGLGAAGGGGGPSLVWIDGHDHDGAGVVLDGEVSVYGIATEPAESPGENGAQIVLQVPPECQPRIQGTGGPPSVGESSGAGSSGTFEQLKASATQRLAPGRHSGLTLGLDGREEYPVVYGEGDLELSGTNAGRGALVVEGSLTVTGSFAFQGLVVVKGDVTLDGGAGGVEILGALMTDGTLVAIGGSTRLLYSSGTLASLQQAITRGRSYEGIYYDER